MQCSYRLHKVCKYWPDLLSMLCNILRVMLRWNIAAGVWLPREKNSDEMDHSHFWTLKGRPSTAGGVTGHQENQSLQSSDKGGAFIEGKPLSCINVFVCWCLLLIMHHSYFTHVLHATTYFFLTATKVSLILIRGFKSLNWTLMVIFKLLAQSCGLPGCWVIHLSSTYGQNTAARKARSVSLQCQQQLVQCDVYSFGGSWMAQLDQPCSLGPNVNPRGCLSAGGSRRFRMGASRADGQTVCGFALHCGQWGVFAALLPEPNRGPDVQKRKAQWSTSGERITSWAHFKSFPADTQGFRFGLGYLSILSPRLHHT